MRRIRRFLALPAPAQAIVARSLFLLPVASAFVAIAGFARARTWLRLAQRQAPVAATPAPGEIARLVHGTAALLRTGCLPRALVLMRLLACHGERAQLRFGVHRLPAGGLEAHAWVELDGEALGESAALLERLAALPMLPAQVTRHRGAIHGVRQGLPAE